MKSGIGMALTIGALMAVLGFFVGRKSVEEGESSASGAMRGGGAGSVRPSKSDRSAPGNVAMERLMGTDGRPASPEAAIRAVIRQLERSPIMGMDYDAMFEAYAVIREMDEAQVQAALLELEGAETNAQVKMTLQMLLVNHWAKEDGREALEYVLAQSDTRMKGMGVMGGVMSWMRTEPNAAYDWYQENKSEIGGGIFGSSGMIEGMMIAAMGQNDMAGAFEKVATLSKESRMTALTTMGSQVGMDPRKRTEFLEHLEAFDDEKLTKQVMEGMVSTWAWQDPQGAADFIASGDFDDETQQELKDSVAQSWAHMDPKGAMEWSIENSEGAERLERVESTFATWVQQDPAGAGEWLQAQPEEMRSDDLYSTASQRLMYSQKFEQAVEFAGQIGDETVRLEKMRQVRQMWQASDEAAAQQWLESLDEPMREAVMEDAIDESAMPWNVPMPGEGGGAFGDPPEELTPPAVEE